MGALSDGECGDVLKRFAGLLGDVVWRLEHLYWIEDKEGRKVRFKMNAAQREFHGRLWHRNAVLKARQLGLSTYVCVLMLDQCLFVSGHHGGVVDKSLPDAAKKLGKIKFAWNMLEFVPADASEEDRQLAVLGRAIKRVTGVVVKGRLRLPVCSDSTVGFRNGSDVEVGVSLRGGTVHLLHLSEFGSVAYHHPKKAAEVLAGAFNSVPKSGFIINESTHEGGKSGLNYQVMKQAIDLVGRRLSAVQWRFHFFGWFYDAEYSLPGHEGFGLRLDDEDVSYFAEVEGAVGVRLSEGQKRWYVDMKGSQRELMQQEYPSTWEEALWPRVSGSIYGDLMGKLRGRGRVGCDLVYEPGFPMVTCWDLGVNDAMAVWAVQFVGSEVRVLRFFQCSGRALGWYVDVIRRWEDELGGRFVRHLLPHDGKRKMVSMDDPESILRRAGLRDVVSVPRVSRVWIGVGYVRNLLRSAVFDVSCTEVVRGEGGVELMSGVDCLCAYHKVSVVADGVSRDVPEHDASSHGCDAFRTVAEGFERGLIPGVGGGFVEEVSERVVYRDVGGGGYSGGGGGEVLM